MKKRLLQLTLLLAFISLFILSSCSSQQQSSTTVGNITIDYLGKAGFAINTLNKIIYVDPYQLPDVVAKKADQIYVTHGHFDSCSPADIAKITGTNTWFIGTSDCAEKVKDIKFTKIIVLDPGFTYNIDGISVDTIRAYTLNSDVNSGSHPFNSNWFGYVWSIDGRRIYYSGFSDYIPEMKAVQNIDIALLVINGVDSMKTEDALTFVRNAKPTKVIAVGYSTTKGSVSVNDFADQCKCDAVKVG